MAILWITFRSGQNPGAKDKTRESRVDLQGHALQAQLSIKEGDLIIAADELCAKDISLRKERLVLPLLLRSLLHANKVVQKAY